MDTKRMPLRTRLAALHGDADQAAKQLDHMARGFHLDIERLLLVDSKPPPARRGLRLGLGRPRLQPSPRESWPHRLPPLDLISGA